MAKNQNEKENKKRRILLLVLLLALFSCVFSTATFAWFTSNKKVNVDDINVDVRAVNGLEISADAITWGVKIGKDDLINNTNNNFNQLPDIFAAMSSVGNITDVGGRKSLQMFNGIVTTNCPDGGTDCDNPTYTLSTTEADEGRCYDSDGKGDTNASAVARCDTGAARRFMAFDIYLKVDKDAELYITENAGVFNTSPDDLGIKNTTRVAFLVQGNINSVDYRTGVTNEEDGTTIDGSVAAAQLNNGEQLVLWEPNYDAHTLSGVKAAELYYGITGLTVGNGNSLQAYEGVKQAFTDNNVSLNQTNSTQFPNYFQAVTPDITSPATGAGRQSSKITLKSGVTKVRVYFWVEGQDIDTENDATGSNMKLNLEFSID